MLLLLLLLQPLLSLACAPQQPSSSSTEAPSTVASGLQPVALTSQSRLLGSHRGGLTVALPGLLGGLLGTLGQTWPGHASQAPGAAECCPLKKVGAVTYSLLGSDPAALELGCLSPCTYETYPPGVRYCFKGGDLASECLTHQSNTNSSSSYGPLNNSNYTEQGETVDLAPVDSGAGLKVYTVGTGNRCVIWNHDISGFNSGRTRELCDQLASEGFQVIVPDYFRGEQADFSAGWAAAGIFTNSQTNWTKLQADWGRVRAFAEERGAESFASVGTCWGSYMTLRLSSLPGVVAGVSVHPSHPGMITSLGEDETTILKEVTAPQLLMPTMPDDDNVKPGGLDEKVLTEKGVPVTIVEFPTMAHGFLQKGDMSDPAVAGEVARAMEVIKEFLVTQFGG